MKNHDFARFEKSNARFCLLEHLFIGLCKKQGKGHDQTKIPQGHRVKPIINVYEDIKEKVFLF